ncbi:MAG TPA: transglutaminase domain-containing protein [Mobilitalea sp.]|nr:transglutaminase domain-containing protein [Mobilitalea sp.]
MNFSKQLVLEIEEQFRLIQPILGELQEILNQQLSNCSEDQKLLMKFLYSSMPMSDLIDHDFSLYLSYADHALFLREYMDWCKEIPERIFLSDVVHYRINSENITDCRRFFYDILIPRIQGKSMEEAAIEINYWCAENAQYKASDFRTAAPITIYLSGTGRCGEESTFTVTALRSVGIPARQVYTPRWAHCDDNHAWVEVWCNGRWYFLGACEPEEALNIGWFTKAASRALLIHSRNFSSIHQEDMISKEGLLTYVGHTGLYAKTREIEVVVVSSLEQPVEGTRVQFEILNSSEYARAATLITDREGKVRIALGLGDINVHVSKDDKFAEHILKAGETKLVINLDSSSREKNRWLEYTIKAPEESLLHPVNITEEQKEINKQRLAECDRLRNEKLEDYYKEELANQQEAAKEILKAAGSNFHDIFEFVSRDHNPYRLKLLKELASKDYFDSKAEVLEEHLEEALKYKDRMEDEIFCKYVLSPRISYEFLTPYRKYIAQYFTEEQKRSFAANPSNIWEYMNQNMSYRKDRDYSLLITSPAGSLKLKVINEASKKVLFVAICRTLGIPARLNPVDAVPQYYDGTVFINTVASQEQKVRKASLYFEFMQQHTWCYYQTWTIGKLENCCYKTLDYTEEQFGSSQALLSLEPGEYRIITANRSPAGDIQAAEYYFDLEEGESKTITLHQKKAVKEALMEELDLPELLTKDGKGNTISLRTIAKGRKSVFIWLEEGKEPTEHILNEIIEQQEAIQSQAWSFAFLVKGESAFDNKTLSKVLTLIPGIHTYFDYFGINIDKIAGLLNSEPDKLPFVIVTDENQKVIYTSCGYNVGSVKQILKAIR